MARKELRGKRRTLYVVLLVLSSVLVSAFTGTPLRFATISGCYIRKTNPVQEDGGTQTWSTTCGPNHLCNVYIGQRIDNDNAEGSNTVQQIAFDYDRYEVFDDSSAIYVQDELVPYQSEMAHDTVMSLEKGSMRCIISGNPPTYLRNRRIRTKGTVTSAGAYGGDGLLASIDGPQVRLEETDFIVERRSTTICVTSIAGKAVVEHHGTVLGSVTPGACKEFPILPE